MALLHTRNTQVARHCITFLFNVAMVRANTPRVVREGGLEACMTACVRHNMDSEMVAYTTHLSFIVCEIDGGHTVLVEKCVPVFLIGYMETVLGLNRGAGREREMEGVEEALKVLANISGSVYHCKVLVRQGLLEVVHTILRLPSVTDKLAEVCMTVLQRVADVEGCEEEMVKRDVAGVLTHILTEGVGDVDIDRILPVLMGCAMHGGACAMLIERGGPELARAVLSHYPQHQEAVECGGVLLSCMSEVRGGERQLLETTAGVTLQIMGSHADNPRVAQVTATYIRNIGLVGEIVSDMVEYGFCPALVNVSRHHCGTRAAREAGLAPMILSAYRVMSQCERGILELNAAGAIPIATKYLNTFLKEDAEVTMYAMVVLETLACDDESLPQMFKVGAHKAILRGALLHPEDLHVTAVAVGGIVGLARQEKYIKPLISGGAATVLSRVCRDHADRLRGMSQGSRAKLHEIYMAMSKRQKRRCALLEGIHLPQTHVAL
ncbi:hypothetical protein KIPB_003190 [Kipferlia bialata]|uniref:Armadillo-like helical n=1 Tax=Kipferlia bialata TaxID=797122 RepID=A0A9K3GGV2_9EUKA|nr:hypothetical protein KIPB_003190 [Kipferlia bialata]|eukprot:g3190.t1